MGIVVGIKENKIVICLALSLKISTLPIKPVLYPLGVLQFRGHSRGVGVKIQFCIHIIIVTKIYSDEVSSAKVESYGYFLA